MYVNGGVGDMQRANKARTNYVWHSRLLEWKGEKVRDCYVPMNIIGIMGGDPVVSMRVCLVCK